MIVHHQLDLSDEQAAVIADRLLVDAGLPNRQFPMDLADACEILLRNEYDADPCKIRRLEALGQLCDVEIDDEAITERALARIALALEERRDWKMTPSQHDGKKFPWRTLLELALAEGDESLNTVLEKLRPFDLRLALTLLTTNEQRLIREHLLVVVQTHLIALGVDC